MVINDWKINSRNFRSPMEPTDLKYIFHIKDDKYIVLPRWHKVVWKLTILALRKEKTRQLSNMEW